MTGDGTPHRVVVFDLDRTLTRFGTWTPFLFWVLLRRFSLGRLFGLTGIYLSYATAGGRDRRAFKEAGFRCVAAGASRSEITQLAEGFAAHVLYKGLRPQAPGTVLRHKDAGDTLILATASVDLYAEMIAGALGIEATVATEITWADEMDGGRAKMGANCYGQEKLRRVQRHLGTEAGAGVLAYSDDRSDTPLLTWAETGVAVNPKSGFRNEAGRLGLEVEDWDAPA